MKTQIKTTKTGSAKVDEVIRKLNHIPLTKKQLLEKLKDVPDDFVVAMCFNGVSESGEFLGITSVDEIDIGDSSRPKKEKVVILYSDRARVSLEYPYDF